MEAYYTEKVVIKGNVYEIEVQFIHLIIFIFCWPYYYITGMIKYDSDNPNCLEDLENATKNEIKEYQKAIGSGEKVSEAFDVLHCYIKLFGYRIELPKIITTIICCIAVPTAFKHAYRKMVWNCPRNAHHCLKENHKCSSVIKTMKPIGNDEQVKM